jgi:D-arabinose 1-dehydrogenase-like Zn-dependent alcohol dehydrogenase
MAYSTIFGYQVIPQTGLKSVGIIGNGLISQAIVEICLERNIQCVLVSEHNSVLVNSNNLGKLTKLCRGELNPENFSNYSVVVVCTNNWKDYEIALNLVDKGGCIVLLGFPGRNDEKPSFNPFEPNLFYVKNTKVVSLPITRLDLDSSEEKWLGPSESVAKIVSYINLGSLGEISRQLPTISYTELGDAYENLKNGLNRPLSYVLKW